MTQKCSIHNSKSEDSEDDAAADTVASYAIYKTVAKEW
jgi:hypothetical protein